MKRAIWVVAMVLPLLLASHAYAGGVTLTLNRASLTNVVDAAGTTQYEGGTIFRGATQIGIIIPRYEGSRPAEPTL